MATAQMKSTHGDSNENSDQGHTEIWLQSGSFDKRNTKHPNSR